MNYSLPEVAAQYVQSGTITAKIRGTGTVESGDPYNVKITETRTISSVLVKTGDKVEKGAPLLLLEDKESKELTDAQKALDEARLQFELAMLGKILQIAFIIMCRAVMFLPWQHIRAES